MLRNFESLKKTLFEADFSTLDPPGDRSNPEGVSLTENVTSLGALPWLGGYN